MSLSTEGKEGYSERFCFLDPLALLDLDPGDLVEHVHLSPVHDVEHDFVGQHLLATEHRLLHRLEVVD